MTQVIEDRPLLARKYTGELTKLLVDLHKRELTEDVSCNPDVVLQEFGLIESGRIWYADNGKPTKESLELFNGALHPKVDGYDWYRGYCIPTKNGRVFLYTPWRPPQDTRPYEVFVDGNVNEEEVKNIITTFVSRSNELIDKKVAEDDRKMREHVEKLPWEAYLDNRIVYRWHQYVEDKTLTANVKPREKWSDDVKSELDSVSLSLFVMPYSSSLGFDGLEKHIGNMKDKKVDMDDFPNLRVYAQESLSVDLEKGMVYDLIAMGKQRDGTKSISGGRLTTEKVDKVPYPFTLEEMKFLAVEDLGLTPHDAKGVKATITPMTAWGMSGRFIIAGFDFGNDKGSMVQHNGVVSHYHGYSTKEIRKQIKR